MLPVLNVFSFTVGKCVLFLSSRALSPGAAVLVGHVSWDEGSRRPSLGWLVDSSSPGRRHVRETQDALNQGRVILLALTSFNFDTVGLLSPSPLPQTCI